MTDRRNRARAWLACLLLVAASASADSLRVRVQVSGGNALIGNAALANIRAHVTAFHLEGSDHLSRARIGRLAQRAGPETLEALKPFGFYRAQVTPELEESAETGNWVIRLVVTPGEPVRVSLAEVQLLGAGANDRVMREWLDDWPLESGAVLDQTRWEQAKRAGLSEAESRGYFLAAYTEQRIEIDLERNRAVLTVNLDTGPQAHFGATRFDSVGIDEDILQNLRRFEPGDRYREYRVSDLREDLDQAGWFERFDIRELRDLEADPPVVDLEVSTQLRQPNTYQATLGYGTDSGPRVQFDWQRHMLSPRGDSLNIGFGYQDTNDEYAIRAEHRLPRRHRARQHWLSSVRLLSEQDEIVFRDSGTGETQLPTIEGTREQVMLRYQRSALRSWLTEREPLHEGLFAEWLDESFDADDNWLPGAISDPGAGRSILDTINEDTHTLSLGLRWEWPEISGRGFDISGHHEQVQLMASSDSLLSDVSFLQAYLSTRWEIRLGEHLKLITRGELGYSEADTREFEVVQADQTVRLSLTKLPSEYRFHAGGDRSVRGYSFEDLSNNRYGSNHLLTASVELEYRFLEDWSAAVFYDAGNAFNDWGDTDLKSGAGVGLRWYTVAGPLRLDFARALDKPGKPWTVHFTIGSILL